MSDTLPDLPQLTTPEGISADHYVLAVVHEGVVHDIFFLEGQKAALLSATPTFVQIARGGAQVGDFYDAATGTFTAPAPAEGVPAE